MGMNYLFDTNVLIYYLQQQLPDSVADFIDRIVADSEPTFSVITEIELLCWRTASEEDTVMLRNFVNDSIVIGLNRKIKEKTVAIRRHSKIKLPDAIIAATGMAGGMTLLTRNVADFRNIDGLSYLNPWELPENTRETQDV
jgi:predicted nucleic acid-binding protein